MANIQACMLDQSIAYLSNACSPPDLFCWLPQILPGQLLCRCAKRAYRCAFSNEHTADDLVTACLSMPEAEAHCSTQQGLLAALASL